MSENGLNKTNLITVSKSMPNYTNNRYLMISCYTQKSSSTISGSILKNFGDLYSF